MKILAIDPGTTKSGWCILSENNILGSGVMDNNDMRLFLRQQDYDVLAIEMITSYKRSVGASVFETCLWIGRFMECSSKEPVLISRQKVKSTLGLSMSSNDQAIRRNMILRFGAPGTKQKPGKTYGVTSHAWQALALAVACQLNFSRNSKIKI